LNGNENIKEAGVYRRRQPEKTVLYRVIQEHFESWLLNYDNQRDEHLPGYVECIIRKHLQCGILAYAFARARCTSCGHDFFYCL